MFYSYYIRQETEPPIQKENNVGEVQVTLGTNATPIILESASPAPSKWPLHFPVGLLSFKSQSLQENEGKQDKIGTFLSA